MRFIHLINEDFVLETNMEWEKVLHWNGTNEKSCQLDAKKTKFTFFGYCKGMKNYTIICLEIIFF